MKYSINIHILERFVFFVQKIQNSKSLPANIRVILQILIIDLSLLFID